MSNRLLFGIIAGVVLSFVAVLLFGERAAQVGWLGQLFLNALQMLVVPLIMLSVITGVTRLGDVRKLGKLGGWTTAYYMLTMAFAAVLGLLIVNLLTPGAGVDLSGVSSTKSWGSGSMGFTDILLKLVSTNIIASMAKMDLLPLIAFSLAFGAALSAQGERGQPLLDVLEAANRTIMALIRLVMWFAPIGIFGLIAGRFGEALGQGTEAFLAQLKGMAWFIFVVLLGLGIHACLLLPLLLWLVSRRNPLAYLKGMIAALATAFSTSSSSATLPVTIDTVTENNGVDESVAQFVLPVGATINMDGTALYEAMAAVFIAQAAGIQLDLGTQVIIVITATLSAMGAAGIPEAGLVTMVVVLKAANLPLTGLELLLPIDWFLDRFRTTVNVWGDAVGAGALEVLADHDGPSPSA